MIDAVARKYDPIAVSAESTVVAEYIPDAASQAAYQSESALEQELIRLRISGIRVPTCHI